MEENNTNGIDGISAKLYDFDYHESDDRFQSLVDRYCEIVKPADNEILELCCGTGRVSLPIARAGHKITGVDISASMLKRFQEKLSEEEPETQELIKFFEQDVTQLSLSKNDFDIAICPFNSLMMIPHSDLQLQAIQQAYNHLKHGGLFIFDIKNPITCSVNGNSTPTPALRKIEGSDSVYQRFDLSSPFDSEHRQRIYGWYDLIDASGKVTRNFHSWQWRPISRLEAELMLKLSGFKILNVEGGFKREPYTATSETILITAQK